MDCLLCAVAHSLLMLLVCVGVALVIGHACEMFAKGVRYNVRKRRL